MLKNIFKNRIFLCVLTALVFGTIGVSAATYFPSNQVTYDNKTSGLKSTDVQGALDELYNTCAGQISSNQIIKDNNLTKDEYENRYFFKGSNPNNYLLFNGAMWRIISVESDGTLKIIKNEAIGNMAWNSAGSNDWNNSSLKTYLNSTYYNNFYSASKEQVVSHNFSIGSVSYNNKDLASQISSENSKTWNGKVALTTVSEYIRTNSNTSQCGTLSSYNMYYSTCKNTTWMYGTTEYWWTLSARSSNNNLVYMLYSNLYTINTMDVSISDNAWVRPVVYLSASLTYSGHGTILDPYRIN